MNLHTDKVQSFERLEICTGGFFKGVWLVTCCWRWRDGTCAFE